jgi:hypothetical protein
MNHTTSSAISFVVAEHIFQSLQQRHAQPYQHNMMETIIPHAIILGVSIDMGIRHIATSVELANDLTEFYGKALNRVRGHYFWLRRKLGTLVIESNLLTNVLSGVAISVTIPVGTLTRLIKLICRNYHKVV